MVQPSIWFKEEPCQFSMGQTAQSLTCSIMEKPHTGFDECPRILPSSFRARNSGKVQSPPGRQLMVRTIPVSRGSSRKAGTILRCIGDRTIREKVGLRTIRVKWGCEARTIRDSMGSGRCLTLFVGVHIEFACWNNGCCWHVRFSTYRADGVDGPQEMEKKISSSQAQLGQATCLALA